MMYDVVEIVNEMLKGLIRIPRGSSRRQKRILNDDVFGKKIIKFQKIVGKEY